MANINPVNPHTIGGLLTEEWTINPYSSLPSVIELVLQAESHKSLVSTFDSVLQTICVRLERLPATSVTDSGASEISIAQRLSEALRRWLQHTGHLLHHYKPEIRAIIMYILQRKTLMTMNSLMADSFYGLQRDESRRTTDGTTLERMSRQKKTLLALFLALGPYLRERILQHHRYRRYGPYLGKIVAVATLVVQFQYLIGQNLAFDLPSRILDLVVRRKAQSDTSLGVSSSGSNNASAATSSGVARSLMPAQSTLRKSILYFIAFGWVTHFVHESLRSYRAGSGSSSHVSGGDARVPPPPPPSSRTTRSDLQHTTVCILCRRPRRRASTIDGYVYCYDCLVQYVRDHGAAPLSQRKATVQDIVCLYEPSSVSFPSKNAL